MRSSPLSLLAGLALLGLAAPLAADVKAGVDAWTRGDYAAAVRVWQGPAAQGDADALFNLGQAYRLGRGVKQDLTRAEDLFRRASAAGHLQASDNYGLLLFQRGERARAIPYIAAASGRGDPRAQYLLGIAHFNGDIVARDWVRAYALVSLAQRAGLDQASSALRQMDEHIPIEQRREGVALAGELGEQVAATRARQLAAVDLGAVAPGPLPGPSATLPTPRARIAGAATMERQPIPSADQAVAAAERAAAGSSARTAGADYARPQTPPAQAARVPAAPPRPAEPRPAEPRPAAAPAPASAASGPWRVQLGAFGVAGNAQALWNRVKDRPEIAGRNRLLVPAGSVTKLQAGGFASQAEAQSACARLAAAGFACLAVRN